jgi:hypothetical protein
VRSYSSDMSDVTVLTCSSSVAPGPHSGRKWAAMSRAVESLKEAKVLPPGPVAWCDRRIAEATGALWHRHELANLAIKDNMTAFLAMAG